MKICAVVPAAGRGTRLNSQSPKILTPINQTETIWSILREKLLAVADHIHLIVSPQGLPLIQPIVKQDIQQGLVSLSLQTIPLGMGHALFCGTKVWSAAQAILVVWGDQVFVSQDTLQQAVTLHAITPHTVSLPLVRVVNPYVEYVFKGSLLKKINQSREGELCAPTGLSDVGTFVLSVPDLVDHWERYLIQEKRGAQTAEMNFLPFLPFLSDHHWAVKVLPVHDPREARGINTPDDLLFFKELYALHSREIL